MSSVTSQATAIICGQLIDGISNESIPNAVITINGNKISEVGGSELLERTQTIVKLSGTVLPGMIDAHCHPTIGCCDFQLDHLKHSSAHKSLSGLKVSLPAIA